MANEVYCVIELTDAQERELLRFLERAIDLYGDQDGSEAVLAKLRPLKRGLKDDGPLVLAYTLATTNRSYVAELIHAQIAMERTKNRQGWGMNGTKLNTAERALQKFRDAELVTKEEAKEAAR